MQAAKQHNTEGVRVLTFPSTHRARSQPWRELPENATAIYRHPGYRTSPAQALPEQSPELAIVTAIIGALPIKAQRAVRNTLLRVALDKPADDSVSSAYHYVERIVGRD